MESNSPSSSTPSTSPEATQAPAGGAEAAPANAAPAAPAKPASDPRKGLPAIARAQVIGSEGSESPGGRRGPFGGGDRNRGPRPGAGSEAGPKAPDTHSTLRSVRDEGGAIDSETAKEIADMMDDVAKSTPEKGKGKARPAPVNHDVVPLGGKQTAHLRGPRKVESGREHRTGKVVSVGPSDIFIEFGPKELGVLPRIQYKEGDTLPTPGGEIEVVVDKFSSEESLFICSRPGAVQKAAWELLQIGQIVEARVTGVNKGGLELEVAGHRAFMPASQVSLDRIADLSVFIGEKFPCQVTQLDRRGLGNIVLSRRDLLGQERKEKAEKLKATLAEGQTLDGTVRKIMPFGAFIDLGGLDGLCHISDMTYDRVVPSEKNVAKYVKEGEKVRVQILKMDLENNRISLGMKQLSADPFMTATNDITEGADVTGKIVRMTEFGAFVELSPGVDGLLHISEISRKRINKPEDVLKQDQVVTCRVLKIDPQTRRVSLSMKALEAELPKEPPRPGSREAFKAEKEAQKNAMMQARLEELSKETPALRRQREAFRNKNLKGGFSKKLPKNENPFGLTLGQK
ncbi:MAG: 30S ribosomal protein S1 [Phycisphaerales bacterium]|jgi:predicted RNA-binding protein with RPS1 domain|nr:S1 RNA-binding domain-containing protein [Phycisphaeraceae bacterium]